MLDSADDCFESPSFAIASRSRSICLRVAGDASAIAARQSAWMIEKCSICRPIMLLRKTSYMMHIGHQMMRINIICCYENYIWCKGSTSATFTGGRSSLLLGGVRSEESRVGKECVSTCRSWWLPYHSKKNNHTQR